MPTYPLPNSDKLGSFLFWDWIINQSPGRGFLLMLLISPVAIKYVIRPVVEGRLLRRRDEFMSFHCDSLLAFAFGCGLVLVQAMPNTARLPGWFDWTLLVAMAVLGAVHFLLEHKQYSWRQMFSPSKLWHHVLFPVMGYALLIVVGYGLLCAPWSFEMMLVRLLMLGGISGYIVAVCYDNRHANDEVENGKTRFDFAHVAEWQPWQHRYAHLKEDWRRYIADWKQVPGRFLTVWDRLNHL